MRWRSAAVAATLAAAVAGPLGAAFHNHLTKSIPAADEAVAPAPKSIQLWFAEKVEPKFSSITLMTADSAKIALGAVAAGNEPKMLTAEIPSQLAAGKYLVRWRTAGDDGHAVRGTFAFTVK
ncbi:MAG: copper resistance protein CopC [Gemmatimonadales bacterium]|nr:copper resistance protein CopC [Gemmatimonadota bacterium]MDX2059430.1 copper resistance protein CopC [Gemmatimonadales bacterium]